jgi:PAS domain S-box-containing protein
MPRRTIVEADQAQQAREQSGKPAPAVSPSTSQQGSGVFASGALSSLAQQPSSLIDAVVSRGAVSDSGSSFSRLPTLMAQLDTAQRLLAINEASENWFGKPEDALLGQSFQELVGKELHGELSPFLEEALAGKTAACETGGLPGSSGPRRLCHQYLPLRAAQGRVRGCCVVVEDATEGHDGGGTLLGALSAGAVGAWSWDLESKVIICDNHMWQMFEFPAEGQPRFLDSIHKEDCERLTHALNRSITGGGSHEVVYRAVSENRPTRHVAWRGSAVETRQGRVVRLAGVCFDVSHRMRTEEELRRLNATLEYQRATALSLMRDAEEEMFRSAHAKEDVRRHQQFLDSIVENIPGMVFVKDSEDLRFLHANRATERLLGRTREELIGKTEFDLLPAEQAEAVAQVEREVIRTRQEIDIAEQTIDTPDGKRILHTRKLPILDENGDPHYLLAISEDITDRKLAEEALAKERSLLRTVIDNLPQFIFAKDTQSRFVLNNRAHAEFMGATYAVEVLGKSDHDIHPPELSTCYYEDDQKVIRSGEGILNKEEPIFDRTGARRWLSTTKVPLKRPDGKIIGLVGLSRDITEQKKAAERMERMVGELARSNAELEQFAYVASHDLQEPLRKIQAFSSRLRDRWGNELGEQGTDYLGRVENAAARMQVLIEDLLSYSRVTSKAKPFVPVDLAEVADGVLSDLEARVERLQARVEVGPLLKVAADPTQMRQLLQNLIGNALKFHRKDVTPVVRIHAETLPETENGPEVCRIYVEDNGIGFDPKHASKIFQVFQRLHSRDEYQGSGIGLAVCKKIVDRHGGAIDAQGRRDGATFVVTLPVTQAVDELEGVGDSLA